MFYILVLIIIIIIFSNYIGATESSFYKVSDIYTIAQIKKIFTFEKKNKGWTESIYKKYINIRNLHTTRKFLYIVDNKPMPVLVEANDTVNQQILTDYFIDNIRYKCKNIYFDKPQTASPKPKTIEEYLKYRETLYDYKNMNQRQCFLYPINIARYIFEKFKPKKILDMCAGWGDRLIAAALYGADIYYGVDPNLDLHAGYNKIHKLFMPNAKYKFLPMAFEDITTGDLDGHKFDLMFSCPPYFNTEQYSQHEGQSSIRYKNINLWLENFMYKSIDIIYDNLELGGYFIMQLSDNRDEHFTDKVLDYAEKRLLYLGCITATFFTVSTQPIWVFRKLEPRRIDDLYYPMSYHMIQQATIKNATHIFNMIHKAYKNPEKKGWTDESHIMVERISFQMLMSYINVFPFFIYMDEGKLKGCVCVIPKRKEGWCNIELLTVDPEYQSHGIGGKLLDFAEQYIYDYLNIYSIGLYVYGKRAELVQWYNKKGFKTIDDRHTLWILKKEKN